MKKIITIFSLFLFLGTTLFAGSKRMVFVEEYSSANCGTCTAMDPAFHQWSEQNADRVIETTLRTNNAGGTELSNFNSQLSARYLLYTSGGIGTPYTVVNGEPIGLPQPSTLSSKVAGYSDMSPITLTVLEDITNDKINVTAIVQSDEKLEKAYLFVALIEKHIKYSYNIGSTNIKDFYNVSRQIAPHHSSGANVSMDADGAKSMNFSFDMDPVYNKDQLQVIAWVQIIDNSSREVLQAARAIPMSEGKPAISSSKELVDFGQTTEFVEETITITNTGLATLTIDEMLLANNTDEVFHIMNMSELEFPIQLSPFGTQDVELKFKPRENGDYSAKLIVKSDAEGDNNYKIDLSGSASNIVPYGEFSLDFEELDFGDVGEATTLSFILENTGTGDLEVSNISVIDAPEDIFIIKNESTALTLKPFETVEIFVEFTPDANKPFFGTLLINSNAKNNEEFTLELYGYGEGVSETPKFASSTDLVDFGETDVVTELSVEISNKNNVEMVIETVSLVEDDDKVFFVTPNIPAKPLTKFTDAFEIKVKYLAIQEGDYEAKIRIKIKDMEDQFIGLKASTGPNSVTDTYLTDNNIINLNINPNPINSNSKIDFNVNISGSSHLDMDIYNINGVKVQSLFSDNVSQGNYSQALNIDNFNSGKYFIVVTFEGHRMQVPMIINK